MTERTPEPPATFSSPTAPEPLPEPEATERPRSIVAVFSHTTRANALAITRAAFADVGLPIEIESIQWEPPRQARNRRNAREAIKRALEQLVRPLELPGLLLIEDDVTPARTLPAWLAQVERTQDRPVALYTPTNDSWYPPRLKRVARGEREASRSEIATIEPATLTTWWGSQAVWLPTEWAEFLVRDPRMEAHERALGSFDVTLARLIVERGATLGVAVPNVVQHREERSLITPSKQPSRSASFSAEAPAPAR